MKHQEISFISCFIIPWLFFIVNMIMVSMFEVCNSSSSQTSYVSFFFQSVWQDPKNFSALRIHGYWFLFSLRLDNGGACHFSLTPVLLVILIPLFFPFKLIGLRVDMVCLSYQKELIE